MIILIVAVFAIFGAVVGSFLCCQVWRMRLKYEGKKDPGKWSVCLNCGKRLKWDENIPVISWIKQKGKCKKCGAKIGKAEILSEVGMAVVFSYFGVMTAQMLEKGGVGIFDWAEMAMLIITTCGMWMVLIYDAKWKEMPTKVLTFVNACAIMALILRMAGGYFDVSSLGAWVSLIGAIGILPGIYFLLYFLSKEKYVGSGDWILALAIALILGRWELALVELMVANMLASIIMAPKTVMRGKKKVQVPFGPFLVIGMIIVLVTKDLWLQLMMF